MCSPVCDHWNCEYKWYKIKQEKTNEAYVIERNTKGQLRKCKHWKTMRRQSCQDRKTLSHKVISGVQKLN